MSVPGVGPVTALSFKAGVDDPNRFKSSRTVGAHFGLTPRRFQSGENDNPGHISRAGDAEVRSALYVAAHSLLTRNAQWSSLKAWGIRLAKTRGHRRAVIADARKLATILHRMWLDARAPADACPCRADIRTTAIAKYRRRSRKRTDIEVVRLRHTLQQSKR